jgi:hypothetical protein
MIIRCQFNQIKIDPSLFKIDDNKKITDPIHNIINIVNNCRGTP